MQKVTIGKVLSATTIFLGGMVASACLIYGDALWDVFFGIDDGSCCDDDDEDLDSYDLLDERRYHDLDLDKTKQQADTETVPETPDVQDETTSEESVATTEQ